MHGGVHFQDGYNRNGGYCSNMIIFCRILQLFHNFDQNLLEIKKKKIQNFPKSCRLLLKVVFKIQQTLKYTSINYHIRKMISK